MSDGNLRAARRTLAALRDAGHLDEDLQAADIEALKRIARALDETPDNAALWARYQDQVDRLTPQAGGDDDLERLFAALDPVGQTGGRTEVGDTAAT